MTAKRSVLGRCFTNRRFVSGKSYINNDSNNINYGAHSCKSLSCKDIHSFHHMHARTRAHARTHACTRTHTHTRARVTNICITGDGLVE